MLFVQSCARAERCLIRLSKHSNRAFLTFETWSGEQSVMQDVPVLVQSMRSLEQWEEPLLDEPKVKLHMPGMQILHTLAEKMKGVSDIMEIHASSDGQLKLSVLQSQVSKRKQANSKKRGKTNGKNEPAGAGLRTSTGDPFFHPSLLPAPLLLVFIACSCCCSRCRSRPPFLV